MALIRLGLRLKKIRLFLPVVFFAISSMGYCEKNLEIKEFLATMPTEDRRAIEDLFYLLFAHGDFAYTFMAVKPMSMVDYTMHYAQSISSNKRFTQETSLARKGFDTWIKYEHLFSMKKLRLNLKESTQYGEHFCFTLINPDQCLSIIKNHLSLFHKYSEKELKPEEYLELLCEGKFFREKKIDTTILGLLLGYPEEDVFTFSIIIEDKKRKKGISSILIESQTSSKKEMKPCRLTLKKNPIKPISTPYFMSDRKEEQLKDIKLKYESKKSDLIEMYYSEQFLEKILERFL